MKRVLMYSQDGMGLGHLRRSSNIAHELLRTNESCDVLIVADSPATRVFAARPGIDVLKLPTIIKTGSASWRSTNWRNGALSMDVRRVIELRSHLILQTFRDFRPDTVLIDHMPVGALGELKPMLNVALDQRVPPRLFLGLRDILDSPAVIRRVWRHLGAYDYLSQFDAVLVYGSRDIYDATVAYELGPHARRVVYCNYVSPHARHSLLDHRADEPFVLVTGGGGADAFPLESKVLTALPRLHPKLRMGAVMLTGPNMRAAERETLLSRASPMVRFESSFDKAAEWIQKASIIVTMGGYNSLCEVLKWRKKGVVVPRQGPSTEQRTRARLFGERRLVGVLDFEDLTSERLANELESLLSNETVPDLANIPGLDGAERAAEVLLRSDGELGDGVAGQLIAKGGNGSSVSGLNGATPRPVPGTTTNPVGIS
jgi:predicted glycosyltransferase